MWWYFVDNTNYAIVRKYAYLRIESVCLFVRKNISKHVVPILLNDLLNIVCIRQSVPRED